MRLLEYQNGKMDLYSLKIGKDIAKMYNTILYLTKQKLSFFKKKIYLGQFFSYIGPFYHFGILKICYEQCDRNWTKYLGTFFAPDFIITMIICKLPLTQWDHFLKVVEWCPRRSYFWRLTEHWTWSWAPHWLIWQLRPLPIHRLPLWSSWLEITEQQFLPQSLKKFKIPHYSIPINR